MCGIVGAIAERNITAILVEGLKRLEYRGYDSAGVAIMGEDGNVYRRRRVGKVAELQAALAAEPLLGKLGIAHTRWATHGAPTEDNAHPHFSTDEVAVVHNGIIENHEALRTQLKELGYVFTSQTDTEVIAHLLHHTLKAMPDIADALKATVKQLQGAYGLAAISIHQPDRLVAARSGSPLVIGLGMGENFLASDQLALRQVTDRFMYLEEGDIAEIRRETVRIWDADGLPVERESVQYHEGAEAADKGEYRHFMMKEIHEQPTVVQRTLEGRLGQNQVLVQAFGPQAAELFAKVRNVQIVACGTSYHAGMVARYWLEGLAGIPCQVEVASEFRYRKVVVQPDTLFVSISQSGETADTLAALRNGKQLGFLGSLAICNVGISSLVRESDLTLLTQAGPEIGVASTKAFTTQLVALMLLTLSLGQVHGTLEEGVEAELVAELRRLPTRLGEALAMDTTIERIAELFAEKHHTLFLGRGAQFPLALVDKDMPVVTVAPNNELLEKLKSNLQEVRARGGELVVFADEQAQLSNGPGTHVVAMPHIIDALAPILYTIPLQLLSYYVAVLKGTDVDQPRNLAKSVTVE
jgi:glucosamine--fructose-6-phosphate aminotransferase (isomerizing)